MKTHLVLIVMVFFGTAIHAQNASTNASRLLTIEGKVEVARAGVATWTAGQTNQPLNIGDRVRTGARSRTLVQYSDLSTKRVDELSTIEIRPPQTPGSSGGFEVKSGGSYFFNRERPGAVEFRTPLASGAIRGTELHLRVAENGRTEVALLDGAVDLTNEFGALSLVTGDQAVVEPGQPPRKTPSIEAINIIQWVLYYPGVLDVDELGLTDAEKTALATSIAAYRSGDLLQAQASYPENRQPGSNEEKIYRAATLLSAGQAGQASDLLGNIVSPLADALREIIATVKNQEWKRPSAPVLATEWMAESYYLQSQSKLSEALRAGRSAAAKSPAFGFAWVRVAELEFSFGHTDDAFRALKTGLELSPRNAQGVALRGFLLAAQKKFEQAEESFSEAIALDGGLGNAWLGRGLIKIRRGFAEEGRKDLQVSATLEPQRALLRSYLGKAFSQTRDSERAEKELRLAQRLDPNDPTAWLYSALLAEQQNRINEAVRDLEKSQDLNNNRSVFRSQLLLDQDKAVRSANLARIYQDVGMIDWSVREASRAVSYDYGNFSAHQFLANSYDALRDPKQINLRYEAPAVTEYFIASLLAPVGATPLSQNVSAQEYSRLFDRDHIGIASSTEYFSSGDWIQRGSQYGTFGSTDWSLDAYYRTENGQRKNNDVERTDYTVRVKQEITPSDTIYLEAQRNEIEGGDLLQHYSQNPGDPNGRGPSATFRFRETQEPNLFLGYHHEWSPGVHTLFLAGRFEDDLQLQETNRPILFFRRTRGEVTDVQVAPHNVEYRSDLEGYFSELQQIFTMKSHTLVLGGRFQYAFTDTFNSVSNIGRVDVDLKNRTYLDRESAYIYDQWSPWEPLQLTAGVTYDRLRFPDNVDTSPITDTESRKDQVSPKFGAIWKVTDKTHVRGAYTRSLGGVFFDNSLRLEPTQVGGFNQAFRSIAPESSVGLVPGTRFETFSAGLSHEFPTHTYVNVDAELLRSKASRTLGIITNSAFIPVPDTPASTRQRLEYEERSLTVSVNQLVSDEWAFGVRYRLSDVDLNGRFPVISPAVDKVAHVNQNEEATLHQLSLYADYNLPCGFFAQAETVWTSQSNRGYIPSLEGDDLWQINGFLGYRFWRRHAEARIGLLNITDQNYRLNPLTLYSELPRERTFYASFKFYF